MDFISCKAVGDVDKDRAPVETFRGDLSWGPFVETFRGDLSWGPFVETFRERFRERGSSQ